MICLDLSDDSLEEISDGEAASSSSQRSATGSSRSAPTRKKVKQKPTSSSSTLASSSFSSSIKPGLWSRSVSRTSVSSQDSSASLSQTETLSQKKDGKGTTKQKRASKKAASSTKSSSKKKMPSNSSLSVSDPSPNDGRQWVDKYAPTSVAAHCMNNKKRDDIAKWITLNDTKLTYQDRSAQRCLILTGPPGCGKSSLVRISLCCCCMFCVILRVCLTRQDWWFESSFIVLCGCCCCFCFLTSLLFSSLFSFLLSLTPHPCSL